MPNISSGPLHVRVGREVDDRASRLAQIEERGKIAGKHVVPQPRHRNAS